MYICPNCNKTTQTEAKFCEECGTRLVEYAAPAQPPVVEAQPVVEQPQPVVEAQPTDEQPQPVVEAQPTDEQPQPVAEVAQAQPEVPQYQYVNPQHQAQYATQTPPPVNQPPMGRVVTGMILSILGLEISSSGLVYLFEYMAEDSASALLFAFILSILCFPPSLIGFIMSKNNVKAGSVSKMSSIGKVLGLISIIVTGVMLFVGMIGSMSM